ncbi:MAG: DUF4276 family protein [Bacteroidia bacterium]|nr:DUF4276 family protein [Bacteroidia bacterium]
MRNRQIFAGYFVEGPTDARFLEGILRKSLLDIAFECTSQIDVELFLIEIDKQGLSFVEQVELVANEGLNDYGIDFLFVHTDADNSTIDNALRHKIDPAIASLMQKPDEGYCKKVVPVIPVYMTEAWMLADKELLKEEIGTELSDNQLGINRSPESIANPKEIIESAIRIAREKRTKRRRHDLIIGELYSPIGAKVELGNLKRLDSFNQFNIRLKQVFVELGLLHE